MPKLILKCKKKIKISDQIFDKLTKNNIKVIWFLIKK